jgi:hypothetical protein
MKRINISDMKTIIKSLMLLLFISFVACSSSGEDTFDNAPPGNNPPGNPSNYTINIKTDSFEGEDFVLAGSSGWNFIVAFKRDLNGTERNFEAINNSLPIIMADAEGNQYNIFGEVVQGPESGDKLAPMNAFIGYWFAWGTFFPGLEIFENSQAIPNQGESVSGSDGWLIPRNEVYVGAPRDAIPAIDNPEFFGPKDEFRGLFPDVDDLCIGLKHEGTVKIYPHFILNWHEIVNDQIDNFQFAVVFCPLTGTATIWNRVINGIATTFGVSGFLYNNNVVPYDRNSSSNWSQMLQQCVQGNFSGTNTDNQFVLETNFETWIQISEGKNLLTTNTGFSRDYTRNPYGSYPINETINFPFNFEDTRLHPKERVLGVIVNGNARAYRFESFN